MTRKKNFALIGVAGFIAPRHMKAIKELGHNLLIAVDKHDSVGILDSYFPDAVFFTEFERFDRHIEKLRFDKEVLLDYVSICSPNYLHDAHVRFAFRVGAQAICEKPLVLNPWNLDALSALEKRYGTKVYTILQLRLHPAIIALRRKIRNAPSRTYDIDLTYITSRGNWYMYSWKGDIEKSGGLVTNIGIHFFDMLAWIFGPPRSSVVHLNEPRKSGGIIELEHARVRWFLSIDRNDLGLLDGPDAAKKTTYRSLVIDGEKFDFSEGFTDLHTESYRKILEGKGFGIKDCRTSIDIAHAIRHLEPDNPGAGAHPLVLKIMKKR